MTKKDLEYGNVVETGNRERYLFSCVGKDELFISLNRQGYLKYYELYMNDTTFDCYTIVKVYIDYTCEELLWERKEPKETPKLTEDEKAILRNIDKKYKYIARNKSTYLWIFINEPHKSISMWSADSDDNNLAIFNHLFQFIKWEDEEPYLIEDLLKE